MRGYFTAGGYYGLVDGRYVARLVFRFRSGDPAKCKACGKCAKVCPRGTIHAINFPAPKPEAPALQGAEPAVKPQPKPEAQPVEVKTEVKPENTVTA